MLEGNFNFGAAGDNYYITNKSVRTVISIKKTTS